MVIEEGNGRPAPLWRVVAVERRVKEIEESKPDLMAFRIEQIDRKVSLMLKVLVTVGISTITGSILLAINLLSST